MLTDLFDEKISGIDKVKKLRDEHGIPMTRELGKEVPEVCTYAESLLLKGINQGFDQGRNEERVNTEKERLRADYETRRADSEARRADDAIKRAEAAEARIRELEAELAARNIHIE